jgi:hypothetical protein
MGEDDIFNCIGIDAERSAPPQGCVKMCICDFSIPPR